MDAMTRRNAIKYIDYTSVFWSLTMFNTWADAKAKYTLTCFQSSSAYTCWSDVTTNCIIWVC